MADKLVFIYTNSEFEEVGQITKASLDFDVGYNDFSSNDFEVSFAIDDFPKNTGLKEGSLIYANGTEFGGIVQSIKSSTITGTVKLSGKTWRGKLSDYYLLISEGSNWYIAKGNANTEVQKMINTRSGLVEIYEIDPNAQTEIELNSILRYTNMLEGIEGVLADQSIPATLSLSFNQNTKKVIYKVETSKVLSDYYNLGETLNAKVSAEISNNFYTKVVGLGGEVDGVQIEVALHRVPYSDPQPGGKTTAWLPGEEYEYWKGINAREYLFEDPSITNISDLYIACQSYMRSLEPGETGTSEIIISADNVNLGDIVEITEEITQTQVTGRVVAQIAKIKVDGDSTTVDIDYKVGGSV